MQTLVNLKFKGVPLVRLYNSKLDIFGIYTEIRAELTPIFDEDIFIQSIKYMQVIQNQILSSQFDTTSNTLTPVTGSNLSNVQAGSYIFQAGLFLEGNTGGIRVAFDVPSDAVFRFFGMGNTTSATTFSKTITQIDSTEIMLSFDVNSTGQGYLYVYGTIKIISPGDIILLARNVTAGQTVSVSLSSWFQLTLKS